MTASEGYDVIGDVHGCNTKLEALLGRMGYDDRSGVWRHQTRQAVFVGDLIDRGPEQLDVIRTVRPMVESGAALIVMGNHEFNAMAYATPDPDAPGEYLRRHTEKNRHGHRVFLDGVPLGSSDHSETIAWFSTMPLWKDLGGLHVVHACWDPASTHGLGQAMVTPDVLIAASRRGTDEYQWVETLCKGPEVELPDGITFSDKDGNVRDSARHRWWDPGENTYATACEIPGPEIALPDRPIDPRPVEPYVDDVPVIFGHYWRRLPQIDLTAKSACVDYSAAKRGPLVAYRWSGETDLTKANLVTSNGCAD